MRKAFQHYFRPTDAELRQLWERGVFSFDASVLLNIYGYSGETRDDLVRVIEENSERVRLPHQFGLEYARNRSSVIVKQISNYQRAEKELKDFENRFIATKRDHPYLSRASLRAFSKIQLELSESRKAIEKLVGADPYADKMMTVFEGRVSPRPTINELTQMHGEARQRYEKEIPPGYLDKDKPEPEAFGDCVGWLQLMRIAKEEQTDVVFVVDDFKADWWQKDGDRTIGPRPELLEEFSRVTEHRVYLYNSENFLRTAKDFGRVDIRDAVIEEVRDRLANIRKSKGSDGNLFDPIDSGVLKAITSPLWSEKPVSSEKPQLRDVSDKPSGPEEGK